MSKLETLSLSALVVIAAVCLMIGISYIDAYYDYRVKCDVREIGKGLSAEFLENLCGKPKYKIIEWNSISKINKEQWIYDNSVYLYIENGKLASTQIMRQE